jgi:uncharacterized membrane protein (DUF485 family)
VEDAGTGARAIDWEAIERSPDFQQLVSGRHRFAWTAGTIGIGLGALYVVLAGVAPDLMGTHLFGSMSVGFAGGVALIVVTWVITLAYMLRSDRVWGPLEERIRAQHAAATAAPATARFDREGEGARAGAEEPR